MIRLLIFLIVAPLLINAQTNSSDQGIQFVKGLTLEQIKQKAKQENKYIFVDCAASWCMPCKKMEKEVFPLKNVGDYMNANFISVHVQMDTSGNDDGNIKAWYADAHKLQQQYNIKAFPTYLFFTPDGKIVHRYLAALDDSSFLKVAANTFDPQRQYYTLLENHKAGKKNYERMGYLARLTKMFGNKDLADKIATDYMHHLNGLSDKELLQKKYLEFVQSFASVLTYKDRVFQFIDKNRERADAVMNEGFSRSILRYVIDQRVLSQLYLNKKPIERNPDWEKIAKSIGAKYDKFYTGEVVSFEQCNFYKQKKDMAQQIKYIVKRYETYGLDTAGFGYALVVNNDCYDPIFKYCNNRDTLNKAITWMEIVLKAHPEDYQSIDTYANLLYKVGRKEEAINWETKALKSETEAAKIENRKTDPAYQDALDKMKKGIPTWTNN